MVLHKELTIMAPAKQVFAYWADFRNFQQFIPMIETIEVLDDTHSHWVIHAPLGYKVAFESVITTFEPNTTLIWESHHTDGFARGELRLFEYSENTRVVLDFEYNLYHHWMQNIARLVSHFGFPSATFDHGLLRIKQDIEKDNM